MDILHPLAALEFDKCRGLEAGMIGARAVRLENVVYIGGPITQDQKSAAQILAYNFEADSWQTFDSPTFRPALAAYYGKLLLAGGSDTSTGKVTNKVWVLQPKSNGTWVQPYPAMITARYGASGRSTLDSHYLLVAGGVGDGGIGHVGRLDVVEVFDGLQWSKVQSLPIGCWNKKSFVHDGKWYLAGGLGQGQEIFYASLQELIATASTKNPDQCSVWKQLPEIPLEQSSIAYYGNQVIAIGGGHPRGPSRKILAYSPRTHSWVKVGELPVALMACTTIALPTGELLVVGGVETKLSSQYSARVFKGTIQGVLCMNACHVGTTISLYVHNDPIVLLVVSFC